MDMKKVMILLLTALLLASVLLGCSVSKEGDQPEETVPVVTEPVVYDSYYYFYDYGNETYIYSDVATYQAVTGGVCELSALSWEFLEGNYEYVVEGYDDRYGIFLYEYDAGLLEQYRNYLISAGYICKATEQFIEGFCYYFYNAENEYIIELFVAEGNAYLVIEPYLEAE